MTCLRCVCQSALLVLVIASPPKCSSGLSCRAHEKLPKTGETSLLKTKAMDRVLSQKGGAPAPATGRTFYVFAHMVLEPYYADWAMATGANCLETDIVFTHTGRAAGTGAIPIDSYHGMPCDAGCPHLWSVELFVMTWLGGGGFPVTCDAGSLANDLLDHIVQNHPAVQAIHLDDKNGKGFADFRGYLGFVSEDDAQNTGELLANVIVERMWKKGFRGDAIIFGGACDETKPHFLIGIIQRMARTIWLPQTWIGWEVYYDQGGTNQFFLSTFIRMNDQLKATVKESERGYKTLRCDGTTSCFFAGVASYYHTESSMAVGERTSGRLDYISVWTVDFPHDMRIGLEIGWDCSITNAPSLFVSVAWDANRPTPTAT
jgi:hypothetical protein